MNILVVNDDGINSLGIHLLAEHAKSFGKVTVVAPDSQCSAMSQKLTIFEEICIKKHNEFPVDEVDAYSVSGTPADCVKLAYHILLKEKPDIVLSGVNKGYNLGIDIAYSGTVGAAFEALQLGIPAIAFSTSTKSDFHIVEQKIDEIISELLATPISKRELFNVNFPPCSVEDCKGVQRELLISPTQYYLDRYKAEYDEFGVIHVKTDPIHCEEIFAGTDVAALKDNYITISRIANPVL